MANMTSWQIFGAVIQILGSIATLVGLGLVVRDVREVIAKYFGLPRKRDANVTLDVSATATFESHAGVVVQFRLRGAVEDKLDQIEEAVRDLRDGMAEADGQRWRLSLRDAELGRQISEAEARARSYTDDELRRRSEEARTVGARDVTIALLGIVATIIGQIVALWPF
ncbi:hypothetical protein AB4Z55_20160 [Gordonia sp. ABKF26]|uniref:hypothetical protein n=1 Tax=Gordonia sp. ABKF26 TaxID=3238687 RepID=UPI0034E519C2